MDNGLSWADQWDYNDDPPPAQASEDRKKRKDGSKSGTKKFSIQWVKELCKKSNNK
ncbi:uncharacterized protein LOC120286718 [Eucalyptus grandis]|uniref:Uncharacterized protein n=1 Tax=Eucalyptus globulus TaxID=34317 RepID=A0ABD3JM52_EUCGL|nr:uncharacterized protein LOC120286718 [Eucalyptus grandis]